jgi:two-component system, NtrC family, response regulator AtoC
MKANVLIVDDDAGLRRALADRLDFWGHTTEQAADGQVALEAVARREFDLILLDLAMPRMTGMDLLRSLREGGCTADVVILTAHGVISNAVEAIRLGATDFLLKPADFELLKTVVERAMEKRQLQRVNRALTDQLGDKPGFVVARAPAMSELLDTATRAAQSNATILLTGESGCGKQVLAEMIHHRSPRARSPFVYVNCVALSDELIESTLFGHEKGAFTGAVALKEGRIEAASDGTAFLDEIGDITPRLQTKLLHFLETGEFERVGGTRTISIDCRIIAATNRNLEAAVKEGGFREDLYLRLNVIRLAIPPLRERREDIPELAEAFLERFAHELRRGRIKLGARTQEIMQAYPWPGNVRQLKNAIERMVVLARTDTLTPDLLPPEVFGPVAAPVPDETIRPLKDAVKDFRRDYIARALARNGGNQTKAAEQLGLQRTFLNRMIREYGL